MESNCNTCSLNQPKANAYSNAAELARTLSNVAIRTLVELIRQANPVNWRVAASVDDLATGSGISRRSIIRGLAQLAKRELITSARTHRLNQNATYEFCSAILAPPQFRSANLAPQETTETARNASLAPRNVTNDPASGANLAPQTTRSANLAPRNPPRSASLAPRTPASSANLAPRNETSNKERASRARVDSIDKDFKRSIDSKPTAKQIVDADPAAFTEAEHAEVARALQSYQVKFRPDKMPARNPDRAITAQYLTAAGDQALRLIQDLQAERKRPGDTWGWYVTVAAERCAGIGPDELKAERAARHVGRKAATPAPAATSNEAPSQEAIDRVMAKLVGTKSMAAAGGARIR